MNNQPEPEYDEWYFGEMKKHLKSIMKDLVGYETK